MLTEIFAYIATDFHNLNASAFEAVNFQLPREESQSQFIVSQGALITVISMIPNPDIWRWSFGT